MIAVDTSALVAIALDEPKAQVCRDALRLETHLLMSAGTMAEAMIVAGHNGFAAAMRSLIERFGIEIVPVTEAAARRVAAAHMAWGRGAHPAALNFGDCFAYEVAQAHDCPLLFVGEDFNKTDVKTAI